MVLNKVQMKLKNTWQEFVRWEVRIKGKHNKGFGSFFNDIGRKVNNTVNEAKYSVNISVNTVGDVGNKAVNAVSNAGNQSVNAVTGTIDNAKQLASGKGLRLSFTKG